MQPRPGHQKIFSGSVRETGHGWKEPSTSYIAWCWTLIELQRETDIDCQAYARPIGVVML